MMQEEKAQDTAGCEAKNAAVRKNKERLRRHILEDKIAAAMWADTDGCPVDGWSKCHPATQEIYRNNARAALDALDARTLQDLAALAAKHGYAVVPVEPTKEMVFEARHDWHHGHGPQSQTLHGEFIHGMYHAMIEAGRIK